MHDFDDKLAEGQHFERVLDRFFSAEYEVVAVNDFMQRQGKDRIFTPRAGGDFFGVEYKADSVAARTNNAFIETRSTDRVAGWAHTSKAHRLVYYIPPRCIAYVIDLNRLRAALPAWEKKYPRKAAENATYNTIGVTVPMAEVEAIAERKLIVPPDGDLDGDADGRIQVQGKNGWEAAPWARGLGTSLNWRSALARLASAQRIWPHIRYRIVEVA